MEAVKAIIFDLDGVLVNSRLLHFETFRDALHEVCPEIFMTWSEHEREFDGLSTKLKMKKLVAAGKITEAQGEQIFQRKQELTREQLPETVKPRESLKFLLQTLKNKGYRLLCASNSIRSTLDETLRLLEVKQFFERTYSNEDVQNPKPAPDIYFKAILDAKLTAYDVLIVEDSEVGRKAAHATGAHVLEVEDAEDVTLKLFEKTLSQISKFGTNISRNACLNDKCKLNIVIPMAGEGSRFRQVGFKDPKPFIPVGGKPMIRWVIENMIPTQIPSDSIEIYFHLIVRTSHLENHSIDDIFTGMPSNIHHTVTKTDGLTEGAACSVLLAQHYINNSDPLIIVNSDQYLEWKSDSFYKCLLNEEYDGCILTFYQPDEKDIKWSYAKIDNDNIVTEVAEKVWISPYATVGLYGWRRGSDYVKYAQQMIKKNIRVKNEFYVCPVYNEAIEDKKKVRVKLCSGMWGLGVPEDLEKFCKEYLQEDGWKRSS